MASSKLYLGSQLIVQGSNVQFQNAVITSTALITASGDATQIVPRGYIDAAVLAQQQRIDAILLGANASDNTLAQLNAITASLALLETTDVANLQSQVSGVNGKLASEIARASSAEAIINADIATVVSNSSSVQKLFTDGLSGEISRAINAESAESARATASEANLQAQIDALYEYFFNLKGGVTLVQ